MRLDVALLPTHAHNPASSVCIVVDVLRASSSIVTLLDRGCPRIVVARDIEEARRLHASLPEHLLCGEAGGIPPDGFAYGNSPSEFARLDLTGRSVILATSNGTRTLAALKAAPAVLVGSLLNRTAVARAALAIAAERSLDVTIVCAAANGGTKFVLEDALGAGAIVDAALTIAPDIRLLHAARFARDAFLTARSHLPQTMASADHAADLVAAGLGEDVAYCARLDVTSTAPMLQAGDAELLIVQA
jgi:2-phosphosulfolactate phosphatase